MKAIHVTVIGEKSLLKEGSLIENNGQVYQLLNPRNIPKFISEITGCGEGQAEQMYNSWKKKQ